MTTSATTAGGEPRPCNRCKEQQGTIDLRGAETVCRSCFAYYVSTKAVKRLEVLQRETAATGPKTKGPRRPQRYLIALSCGLSSTALLHVLTENARLQQEQQSARGQKATTARFEYIAAHVVDDTLPHSPSSTEEDQDPILTAYRTRFPSTPLLTAHLSDALTLPSINWTTLPSPSNPTPTPAHRLASILQHLPSTTSRADLRRLLTRHVLLALAQSQACDALLLGHSTTSLAELTLSETAKGRGHSVPWLVNDGPIALPRSLDKNNDNTPPSTSLPVYSPFRELFRKELLTYATQTADPPLTELVSSVLLAGGSGDGAVVSHRDQSIDDVLARYFGQVEESYPSVVANVVRTTGKLRRPGVDGEEARICGLCGTGLDELGDERWRGEIGDRVEGVEGGANGLAKKSKLCYGCERSVHG